MDSGMKHQMEGNILPSGANAADIQNCHTYNTRRCTVRDTARDTVRDALKGVPYS